MIDLSQYKGESETVNYWLVLATYSQDDPLVLPSVLELLENSFAKEKVNAPPVLREDIHELRQTAKSKLASLIAQKKNALEQLKCMPQRKSQDSKVREAKPKKLTRMQEIFGDQF